MLVMLAAAMLSVAVHGPIRVTPTAAKSCAQTRVVCRRTARANTVGIEAGLNTLAGAGVFYSRRLNGHLNVDTGLGLSFHSVKGGLRLRYNFLRESVTPFAALGLMMASGSLGLQYTSDRGNAIAYSVRPSPFAQGTVGCLWTTPSGLTVLVGLGWAQLLRPRNIDVVQGTATGIQQERLAFSAGSGPSGSVSMGYSF